MRLHVNTLRPALGLAFVALLVAMPALPAGFGIFEHGTKAMGMAGAFTAQADDGSAMFHNVGGLAFQDERAFLAGFTYITAAEAKFTGDEPGIAFGQTGEQETLRETPPHFYWVEPVGSNMTFGLSLNAPFGLTTEWQDKNTWVGRFISERAALQAIDITPNIAFKLSENIGFGVGLVYRSSTVEFDRRLGTLVPGAGFLDTAKTELEAEMSNGLGFTLGMLHKASPKFSWGLSYRSRIEVEYDGEIRFEQILTGIPPVDAQVAFGLPRNPVPVTSAIEFPDMASLGFAYAFSSKFLAEVDINWTGWSSFDRLVVQSGVPGVEIDLEENFEDVYNYRLGFRYTASEKSQWRFGYVYDETPQPDEAVSPLLPDSNRNGFTVGYGRTGGRLTYDLAFMYLPFDERTTTTNHNDFNGTYNQTAWLLGFTLGW